MASSTLTVTRSTTAAPDQVWAVLTDLDSAAEVLSAVDSLERVTSGPYRVGTTWRETRKVMGRSATQEMRVTDVQALGSTRIEAQAGDVRYVTTFDLDPLHPGTDITMRFEGVQPETGVVRRALAALMRPLGEKVTRSMMERDLTDIVAAAEAR